ncbi:MAG: alpha-L-fucosidase [Acidobacteria bacterium]|nr:alpha-L-fucosidase [Acidobacteriota bacterium]
MSARVTTLPRCSVLLAAAAVLFAQAGDRDQGAIRQAEQTWYKTAQITRGRRLAWWRAARFGCFIHWGVYSGPGGEWNGTPFKGYAEHLMRIEKIPLAEYKAKVVAPFNPVKFNADEWVKLIKGAGMGYLVITAKHHDGFAMWPSKVTRYNIRDAAKFTRDPMRELADACRRNGIRFGFYYSHAFDWEDPDAPGNDWDYDNPGGDRKLHGGDRWYDLHPDLLEKARRYVDRKAIPQLRELIAMYHPDILWFDTPQKLPLSEQLRIVGAVREADPDIVINGRAARGDGRQFGDYENTGDRAAEFRAPAGDWETIPTTNESYGYHRYDNSHKPPEYFIRLLARAAARGGNVLLNIGPMGDGEIDPRDQAILRGIGRWMTLNGDSIRGTERTPLTPQAWGETTRRPGALFLHVFHWPADGKLIVGGVEGDAARARLLAGGAVLPERRINLTDIAIAVPPAAPDPADSVIVLDMIGNFGGDPARLLSPTQDNRLSVFDARVSPGLRFTDGKAPHAYVYEWTRPDQTVSWPVRVNAETQFEVWARYSTGSAGIRGRFAVEAGTQRIEAAIEPTAKDTEPREVRLGTLRLPAGEFTLRVLPVEIPGGESIRLFSIMLKP